MKGPDSCIRAQPLLEVTRLDRNFNTTIDLCFTCAPAENERLGEILVTIRRDVVIIETVLIPAFPFRHRQGRRQGRVSHRTPLVVKTVVCHRWSERAIRRAPAVLTSLAPFALGHSHPPVLTQKNELDLFQFSSVI